MNSDDSDDLSPFDTETMAEVCARQGRTSEAAAIYRRLVVRAGSDGSADAESRARWGKRIAELDRAVGGAADKPASLGVPGLALSRSGAELTVRWAVPESTAAVALELVIIRRTEGGIDTERRRMGVESAGVLKVQVPGLHSAVVAVGTLSADGQHFVPLAHQRTL